RPWTSFEEMDVKQRPKEKMANATKILTPASRPSASAAINAIAPTAAAWTRAPAMNTHLRYRTRNTNGVRNTWGSIEPDSRMGTNKPVSAWGTPRVANSHGNTVAALTI